MTFLASTNYHQMKFDSKKIIGSSLMVLILFSTIGFNIISTFCDGCKIENTRIGLVQVEDDLECSCCSVEEHISCCSTINHEKEHHHSKITLAQLKFDSPEAKSKSFQFVTPVFLVHFVSILFNLDLKIDHSFVKFIEDAVPPLNGRRILSLNCILRN